MLSLIKSYIVILIIVVTNQVVAQQPQVAGKCIIEPRNPNNGYITLSINDEKEITFESLYALANALVILREDNVCEFETFDCQPQHSKVGNYTIVINGKVIDEFMDFYKSVNTLKYLIENRICNRD